MSDKSSRRQFIDRSLRIVRIAGALEARPLCLARRTASGTMYQVDRCFV
jgi:hypothetical protein